MLARNSTVFIISVFDASLNLLEVDECSGDCFDNGFSKTLALVLSGQYYLLIESSSYRFSNAQYQLLVKSVALPEIPSKPLSVTASNKTTQDYITVNWSIVPEASSYELYRANEGGSPQFVLDVFDNRYVDQSVVLDSVYHYWVKAKNIAGVISEVLILGAIEKDGKVVLVHPSQKTRNGLDIA